MTRKRPIMQLMDAMFAAGAEVPNVSEWCRVNGVDRRTFYRHRARARAEGQWRPRSRRPKTIPHTTSELVVAEIVRLRQELAPDNGADFIRDELVVIAAATGWGARGWRVPARATINRVLARRGLLETNPRKRPRSSWRRSPMPSPATATRSTPPNHARRQHQGRDLRRARRLHPHPGRLPRRHRRDHRRRDRRVHRRRYRVWRTGTRVVRQRHRLHQPRPPRHTGPSKFARTLTDAGTRLIHSSPYHPQTCGKVERHHQTLKKWLATHPTAATLPTCKHC